MYGEYLDVIRCYNCLRFGHIAKNCKNTEVTCGKCAENHKTEACTSLEKKCINCIEAN